MIVRIIKQNGQLLIRDSGDNLLKTFEARDNLQRALQLLKQLNSIRTLDGTPIYKTRMFDGISVWSFHQNVVFWNFLVPYVKYEETIKFLINTKTEQVLLDSNLAELANYLTITGLEVAGTSAKATNILSSLGSFSLSRINRMIGIMLTLLAFLKARVSKATLLIYTPDKFSPKHGCDFRFYPVYEYVRGRRIRYVEVFHTLLGREFLSNIIKRKRAALYLECLPPFSARAKTNKETNNSALSAIEPHNRKYFLFLLRMLDQGAQVSIGRIRTLTRLLRFTKVKALIAIDDVRYTNELILVCRLNGIKTYGFQHGHFTKYLVGWMNYDIPKELSVTFDKLFVWNEYWKKVLLSYSTQYAGDNVEIGGPLRELKPLDYKKSKPKVEKVSDLCLLVPYETFAPKTEVGEYINRFIDLGIKIFFKLRPDIPYQTQLSQYGIKYWNKVEVIEDIDAEALSQIDAVAGTYSTFLNEMLFYDKPVFVLDTSFDQGHRLLDDGLAAVIKKDSDVSFLLDYINGYTSKKAQAWPATEVNLEETLSNICQGLS